MAGERRILVLEGPLTTRVADRLAEEGWTVARVAEVGELLSQAEQAALVILGASAPGMNVEAYQRVEGRTVHKFTREVESGVT